MPTLEFLDRRPALWLALGAALCTVTLIQTPVPILSWLLPVPFLRYVRLRPGWRGSAAVALALVLGLTVAVLRIVTEPIPLIMAPMFSVPIGLLSVAAYALVGNVSLRPAFRIPAFAAVAALAELVQREATPLLSWGALGYSQVEDLPLMQLASIGGLGLLSFLIHAVGATLEAALAGERVRGPVLGLAGALVLAHGWGSARLQATESTGAETVLVATVDTPSDIGGPDLPPDEVVQDWNATLAARTRRAAAAGAQLVVWTEASTLARRDDVPALHAMLSALAVETGVELVVGYVVPLEGPRFRYENTYVFVRPDGSVHHTYLKHRPVPGEPAVRGTAPQQVVETAIGQVGGAICYDYDSPSLALGHARLDADLVAVPSSDWRGIDPVHTRMAAVRAIEGGHSVLRSTRWGLSAGVDPVGRMRAWRSSFDDDDGVLLVRLPREGRWTLFSVLGELGVGVLLGLVLITSVLGDRYARSHAVERPDHRRPSRPRGL